MNNSNVISMNQILCQKIGSPELVTHWSGYYLTTLAHIQTQLVTQGLEVERAAAEAGTQAAQIFTRSLGSFYQVVLSGQGGQFEQASNVRRAV